MQVEFEGGTFTLDIDELDIVEATHIKRKWNLALLDLQEGADRGDPDALRALYWLMMKQNGVSIDADRANFKVVKFAKAVAKASAEEDDGEGPGPKES